MHIVSLLIGVVVNFFLAQFAFGLAETFTSTIFPAEVYGQGLVSTLHWLAVIASLLYFGLGGLVRVPKQHGYVLTILGWRPGIWFTEGMYWILPFPFMGGWEVDMRDGKIDPEIFESLTADDVAIPIDVFAVVHVANPYIYLNFSDPWEIAESYLQRTARHLVSDKQSKDTTIEEELHKGISKLTDALSTELAKDFAAEIANLGLELSTSDSAQFRRIRLPEKMEAAAAQKRVETDRLESEATQVAGLAKRAKGLRTSLPELSDKEVLDAVQAADGSATRLIIDGSASPIEKAGTMAGGGAWQKQGGK